MGIRTQTSSIIFGSAAVARHNVFVFVRPSNLHLNPLDHKESVLLLEISYALDFTHYFDKSTYWSGRTFANSGLGIFFIMKMDSLDHLTPKRCL